MVVYLVQSSLPFRSFPSHMYREKCKPAHTRFHDTAVTSMFLTLISNLGVQQRLFHFSIKNFNNETKHGAHNTRPASSQSATNTLKIPSEYNF